jgi:hypothetical protein
MAYVPPFTALGPRMGDGHFGFVGRDCTDAEVGLLIRMKSPNRDWRRTFGRDCGVLLLCELVGLSLKLPGGLTEACRLFLHGSYCGQEIVIRLPCLRELALQPVIVEAVGLRFDFVRVDVELHFSDFVGQDDDGVLGRSSVCAYCDCRKINAECDGLREQACDGEEQDGDD